MVENYKRLSLAFLDKKIYEWRVRRPEEYCYGKKMNRYYLSTLRYTFVHIEAVSTGECVVRGWMKQMSFCVCVTFDLVPSFIFYFLLLVHWFNSSYVRGLRSLIFVMRVLWKMSRQRLSPLFVHTYLCFSDISLPSKLIV